MMDLVPQSLVDSIVSPWRESLAEPEESQRQILIALLKGYSKTEYGKSHRAGTIEDAE